MTPQYILRKSLCRPAHCYSSHVPGMGYVGCPLMNETRNELPSPYRVPSFDYDRQRNRAAESEIDNLGYATGYAGYTADNQPRKGILLANWNVFPSDIDTLLERYGYAVEWSDCYCMCENCGLAIQTEPDHMWWKLRAGEWDHEMLCLDCFQEAAESWRSDERDEQYEAATEPLKHMLEYLADQIEYEELDRHEYCGALSAVDIVATLLKGMVR